jgi:methionyl-tRNA formyltransferase
MLTALRMTNELDGGPVYLKRPLSLEGCAKEIFSRASDLIVQMIDELVVNEPKPVMQEGKPTVFARRKPSQSELPTAVTPEGLYDHIRMLDAPGYPNAFLQHGAWRASFTDARLSGNIVEARVRFENLELDGS